METSSLFGHSHHTKGNHFMGFSIEQAPGERPVQYICANRNEIMTNKSVVLGRCERDLCVVLICNYFTINVFRN